MPAFRRGVTAADLALKAPLASPTFTGSVTIPDNALAIADTSGLQTALDAKVASATLDNAEKITAAAYEALAGSRGATTVYLIVD